MDAKIAAVLSGDLDQVRALGPVAEVIGDISRGMIVARPGHRLLIGDFTGIESIVLAHISGQQSKLDEWNAHIADARIDPDDRRRHPYMIIGQSLGIENPGEAYQAGKICDLAFGYLGGLKAYRSFAPPGDASTDSEIFTKQRAWQDRHPMVVRFWHSFNRIAISAVSKPDVPFAYNGIRVVRHGDNLHLRLPSGRHILYPFPRIEPNNRGEDAVIFKDNAQGRWEDYHKGPAHPGTWAENIVSGLSRDVLAEALMRVEGEGFRTILTVHDEIVVEMPEGEGSLDEFRCLIEIVPDWAPGLPVMAKVREGVRFSKPDKSGEKRPALAAQPTVVRTIETKPAAPPPRNTTAPVTPKPSDPPRKPQGEPAGEPPGEPQFSAPPPAPPGPRPGAFEADREQMGLFIRTLFRHVGAGSVSLRVFPEDRKASGKPNITTVTIGAGDKPERLEPLIGMAVAIATQAGRIEPARVFAPPVALFKPGWQAREVDLLEGPVLSVECDAHPEQARTKLEAILGPATMVVASGGVWRNGGGVAEDKLHLHWRLAVPARGDQLRVLKDARRLATAIAGADASSITVVHPLRWPGSLHRKKTPRMCRIVASNPDHEIDLAQSLEALTAAAPEKATASSGKSWKGFDPDAPSGGCWDALDDPIDHGKLASSAQSLANSGMNPGAIYNLLFHALDRLDPTSEEDAARKQRRLSELPGIVTSAARKAEALADEQLAEVEAANASAAEAEKALLAGPGAGNVPEPCAHCGVSDRGVRLSYGIHWLHEACESAYIKAQTAGFGPSAADGHVNGHGVNGHANGHAEPQPEARPETTPPGVQPDVQGKPVGVVDDWPALGEAAYHGLAGRVIRAIEPHTEADPASMLLQFHISVGNMIGRHPYFMADGAEHYPVLYGLIVGQSAKGRKGTSAARIRQVLKIAEPEWVRNNILSGIASGEGIMHQIRDEAWGMRKGKRELVDEGVADKRLLIDEREFSSCLDKMRREGNIIEHTLREGWDCPELLASASKHSPTKVTNPHLGVVGHITVDELRRKLDRVSMANGFANRFLFAYGRRTKLLPHGSALDETVLAELGEATRTAIVVARERGRITMTPDAYELWKEIYLGLQIEVPGLLGHITARGDAQTLRLAMMYALLDQADQIDCVHLRAGLAMWQFSEACAKVIFSDTTGDPLTDGILQALRAVGKAGMARTQINNHFSGHLNAAKIQAALTTLLVLKKASREMRVTSGRPAEVWEAV
jgi:hypothetical protein